MEKLLSVEIALDTNVLLRAGFKLNSNEPYQTKKNIIIFFPKSDISYINELKDDNKCDNQSNLRSIIF